MNPSKEPGQDLQDYSLEVLMKVLKKNLLEPLRELFAQIQKIVSEDKRGLNVVIVEFQGTQLITLNQRRYSV